MSRTAKAGIKLTVFFLVTAFATTLLALTITNARFRTTVGYKAVFSDAVNLIPGDEVRAAGVRVGSVSDVKLFQHDKALVTFAVDKDVPVTSKTMAMIRYRNLIGQRYLALVDEGGGTPLRHGALIPESMTQPALNLTQLFRGFRPLLSALSPGDLNQLSFELVKVLQGEGDTFTALFGRLGSLTNTLANRDSLIGAFIDDLNGMLGPIDQRDQQLGNLVGQLQRFISGLSSDRQAIGNALSGIDSLTATTAGLLQDARPALKDDIQQLGVLAERLDTKAAHDELAHFLSYTPFKLQVASSITAYGSFQNFYLCAVNFILPNGTETPTFNNTSKRCVNP